MLVLSNREISFRCKVVWGNTFCGPAPTQDEVKIYVQVYGACAAFRTFGINVQFSTVWILSQSTDPDLMQLPEISRGRNPEKVHHWTERWSISTIQRCRGEKTISSKYKSAEVSSQYTLLILSSSAATSLQSSDCVPSVCNWPRRSGVWEMVRVLRNNGWIVPLYTKV